MKRTITTTTKHEEKSINDLI